MLSVCRKYKAQYFYMAPKFPYNLPFDEQVTIVVCNNGAINKTNSQSYRIQTFLDRAKMTPELRLEDSSGESKDDDRAVP